MNKQKFSLLFLLLFALVSCGGDDDKTTVNNVPAPTEEEEPTPPRTPTPPTNSCLSNTQRTNITTLMDRLSDFSSITGTGSIAVLNPNNSVTTFNVGGSAIIQKLSDTSWNVVTSYCRVDDPSVCATLIDDYAFINNCFYLRGEQTRILSSSSNTLRITRPYQDGRLESNLNTRNDKFRYSVRGIRNGRTESSLIFEED